MKTKIQSLYDKTLKFKDKYSRVIIYILHDKIPVLMTKLTYVKYQTFIHFPKSCNVTIGNAICHST